MAAACNHRRAPASNQQHSSAGGTCLIFFCFVYNSTTILLVFAQSKQNNNNWFEWNVGAWCYGINDNTGCVWAEHIKILAHTEAQQINLRASHFSGVVVVSEPRWRLRLNAAHAVAKPDTRKDRGYFHTLLYKVKNWCNTLTLKLNTKQNININI